MEWIILIAVSFVASTISGIAGFGGALALLPFLTYFMGIKAAIPVLTVAQVYGNLSRAGFGWKEINWKAVGLFIIGAVPAAWLGSYLMSIMPAILISRIVGILLIGLVIWRRVKKDLPTMPVRMMGIGGAMSGFLSGISGVGGPVAATFFFSLQLPSGAYVASEAFTAIVTHFTKTVIYNKYDLITTDGIIHGSILGIVMVAGSWTGKQVINRISRKHFLTAVELLLIISGIYLLWNSF